jgi:hypothetical protein
VPAGGWNAAVASAARARTGHVSRFCKVGPEFRRIFNDPKWLIRSRLSDVFSQVELTERIVDILARIVTVSSVTKLDLVTNPECSAALCGLALRENGKAFAPVRRGRAGTRTPPAF